MSCCGYTYRPRLRSATPIPPFIAIADPGLPIARRYHWERLSLCRLTFLSSSSSSQQSHRPSSSSSSSYSNNQIVISPLPLRCNNRIIVPVIIIVMQQSYRSYRRLHFNAIIASLSPQSSSYCNNPIDVIVSSLMMQQSTRYRIIVVSSCC